MLFRAVLQEYKAEVSLQAKHAVNPRIRGEIEQIFFLEGRGHKPAPQDVELTLEVTGTQLGGRERHQHVRLDAIRIAFLHVPT